MPGVTAPMSPGEIGEITRVVAFLRMSSGDRNVSVTLAHVVN